MLRNGFLVALLACQIGSAAAQSTANSYVNARFGTAIDFPADWSMVEPGPANDDGRSFTDGNADAQFLAYGRYNVEGKSIPELQREAEEFVLAGVKPSYSRVTGQWFVISAVVGGNIVYHKELLSSDSDIVHSFHAEYLVADKARYDEAVALMANSLASKKAQ